MEASSFVLTTAKKTEKNQTTDDTAQWASACTACVGPWFPSSAPQRTNPSVATHRKPKHTRFHSLSEVHGKNPVTKEILYKNLSIIWQCRSLARLIQVEQRAGGGHPEHWENALVFCPWKWAMKVHHQLTFNLVAHDSPFPNDLQTKQPSSFH